MTTNILIPMTGPNRFDGDEYIYPKPLIDLGGKTILEESLSAYDAILGEKRIIPIVANEDVREFNLDYVLRQLVPEDQLRLISLDQHTQGALCTSLLAVELINNDDPLIISSCDHVIHADLSEMLNEFEQKKSDFGVLTFQAVHPKWSFIRLDKDGHIVEAAEKRPISKNAVAGLYYYRRGRDFVEAAKKAIVKGSTHAGKYFISSSINELVLENKVGHIFAIPSERYTNFYDINAVKNYIKKQQNREDYTTDNILHLTNAYVEAFDNRDLVKLEAMFSERFVLEDPFIKRIDGQANVLNFLKEVFESTTDLSFKAIEIAVAGSKTFIQFELILDEKKFRGVDILTWKGGKMLSLAAHLEEVEL